ncbi:MAG: hypothetical protein KJ749_06960, partial [Planctomycetes bacterium]|nr:hypothetical protein [Planctomycetota bacterium]
RDWLYEWLEKPHRIVQRTYMPDLFDDDLTSLIQRWPAEEREQLQDLLNDRNLIDDSRAVMRAITTFLFDAGEKCRTDITFGSPVTRKLEKTRQSPRGKP